MLIFAENISVGQFKLKVLNSLCHGGPYIAVQRDGVRVAWISFTTKKYKSYEGVSKKQLKGIDEVEEKIKDPNVFNKLARQWNNFYNGVSVNLMEE